MKTKRMIIRFIIILLIFFIILSNLNTAIGIELVDENIKIAVTPEKITEGAKDFIQSGTTKENPLDIDNLKNVSDVVYNILLTIGIIVAVIMGLIIGIKYMTGSVSQKAETKELLTPYIVGCVIIFGAFIIWKIVVELLNQTQQ